MAHLSLFEWEINYMLSKVYLGQWFLTFGEFPAGGEWRSCQVGMTSHAEEYYFEI